MDNPLESVYLVLIFGSNHTQGGTFTVCEDRLYSVYEEYGISHVRIEQSNTRANMKNCKMCLLGQCLKEVPNGSKK